MRILIITFVLTLSSCGASPSSEPVAAEQIARAAALPAEAFSERLTSCENQEQTADDLFKAMRSMMNAQSNPQLNEYRVSAFSGGKVFEIVIEFQPGDLGVTNRNVDILAVREDCAWAYIDTLYDQ